ncbi:MAG: hypothetical protein ACE5JG_03705 [Planctomycetota bacterium]
MKAIGLTLLLLVPAACANAEGRLQKDLTASEPVDVDFDLAAARTKRVLRKWFRHLDPDRTDEEAGDFWSIWKVHRGVFYRDTTRERAHVRLARDEQGRVVVHVAVVRQINDNIDQPDVISAARWVSTKRDPEMEQRLTIMITQSYRRYEVSEHFKERHREKRRTGLRPDLVDRYRDVDLTQAGEIDPDRVPERGTDWGERDEKEKKKKDG